MRRALPLSVHLLLALVALLVGMAAALTTAASASLADSLRTEASRQVRLETEARTQTLSQLFLFRRQHAESFLASLESACSERGVRGRLAWAPDCVAPTLDQFRKSEHALGVLLTYRTRTVRRSGERVTDEPVPSVAPVKIVRTAEGHIEYVMKAERHDLALTLRFDDEPIEKLFAGFAALRRTGEVFLLDAEGRFLASSSRDVSTHPVQAAALAARCQGGASQFVGEDFTGIKSFQSVQPLAALGGACVAARLGYDEALWPAQMLRDDLVRRIAWFVAGGIALSLIAAHWISAPIRRLAVSARRLQSGQFEHVIPLGGPSEVRELGRALDAMSRDLAELVAREQAARVEAEKASRSKDEFLATVSHELRTPLTAVLGWARLLRTHDVPPKELRHGLEVIERSASAQNRLIEDLLDVSRIVSSRLRITREAVPFAELVQAAVEQARPQAQLKHLDLSSDLEDSALVYGDPRRLDQVVSNLLWNAIKFTEPPGHVRVRVKHAGRDVVLTVSDTGVGISPAFLPHVFEWFRQADARSRSQSGLGLGLGIVRHIVQLHHGTVRAESAGIGKGATFTVTLPVFEPATLTGSAPAASIADASTITRRLAAARVLVVEDDDDSRELVRLTLERAGASVEAVASAGDARREIAGALPDVLISDIRMPEEDGYSLMRSLRNAGIATPAIALTAYARQEDADEAHAAGFQVHLPKPIDEGRLIDAVASLLSTAS
jgi:signal transduction histidine kinase